MAGVTLAKAGATKDENWMVTTAHLWPASFFLVRGFIKNESVHDEMYVRDESMASLCNMHQRKPVREHEVIRKKVGFYA